MSDKDILIETNPLSDHLLIAVSSLRLFEEGKSEEEILNSSTFHRLFEFHKSTTSLNCNKIFIGGTLTWWHEGIIAGRLRSIQEIVQEVSETITGIPHTTSTIIGGSAGGYGALLFGHLLKIHRVNALTPQTIIDLEFCKKVGYEYLGNTRRIRNLEYTNSLKNADRKYFDLRNVLCDYNGISKYTIHVSKNFEPDKRYAYYLKDCPHVSIIEHDSHLGHDVWTWLKEKNLLVPLLQP